MVEAIGLACDLEFDQNRGLALAFNALCGLLDLVGEKRHWFYSNSSRTQSHGALWFIAAHSRRIETADQRDHCAHACTHGSVFTRPHHDHHARIGGLGGGALWA